jgi:DNA-binding transcriptional MerR regulator
MADRDHHSIGEVLAMVQEDFPDVTISKIRFLESQGLLNPERTTSGYRKFYDDDVERLRWILHQQRDHYLPLKVIKDRIINGFADADADAGGDGAAAAPPDGSGGAGEEAGRPTGEGADGQHPAGEDEASATLSGADPSAGQDRAPERESPDPLDEGMSTVSMTADELAAASGLTEDQVHELQQFGLIDARSIGAADLYEGEALQVARLTADFLGRGIEVRHLKMYRISAEREAGFYEQVVSPLTGHRDPASRSRARSEVRELVRLGAELKAALLRRSLREQLGGP